MYFNISDAIRQAARERKVLKIVYTEKDGTNEGWRYIEPYSLSKDDGERGLFAWDISRGGIRRFSLDRISQTDIAEQSFNPRYPVEIF